MVRSGFLYQMLTMCMPACSRTPDSEKKLPIIQSLPSWNIWSDEPSKRWCLWNVVHEKGRIHKRASYNLFGIQVDNFFPYTLWIGPNSVRCYNSNYVCEYKTKISKIIFRVIELFLMLSSRRVDSRTSYLQWRWIVYKFIRGHNHFRRHWNMNVGRQWYFYKICWARCHFAGSMQKYLCIL